MTDLENQVYQALMGICQIEYSADLADIENITGLDKATIKGVVGSLVKKQLAFTETGDRGPGIVDIFPIDKAGFVISFGEQT